MALVIYYTIMYLERAPSSLIMKNFIPFVLLIGLILLISADSPNADNLIYLKLEPSGEVVTIDPDNKQLLDCLCRCYQVGQFGCKYDEEDPGHSPSCRNTANGPCICKAFGCFRRPLPTDGDCYNKCKEKYASTTSATGNTPVKSLGQLIDLYDNNKDQFSHCQDLAYAAIYGDAPPNKSISKTKIPEGLSKMNFKEVAKGFVPKEQTEFDLPLQDGDIIILEFNQAPNIGGAAHYAVYFEGDIYQILHFAAPYGGVLSKADNISYFFKKRVIPKPDGTVLRPNNVYQYYSVYRRN